MKRFGTGVSLLFYLGMLVSATTAAPVQSAPFNALHWRSIGPFRGGRTVAITGIPKEQKFFDVAPTDGGVGKTDDYVRPWTPIFDGQPTQSIGALAVAQSDPQTS